MVLQILLLGFSILLFNAAAFSTDPSPWSPSKWRLILDIGRESGTDMPSNWGSSGGRLVLPIDVLVESDACSSRDELVGSGALTIRPFETPTYINDRGEQEVSIKEGGWKIQLPPGKKGHAATLQFWLDFETEASRNDVTLPAGRIYFAANCWREEELIRGSRAIAPIVADYEEAQEAVEKQLSHETGDRRLDGTDPIETMIAYKDMTELIVYRDEMRRRLKDAERYLPRNADEIPKGHWPGATEVLSIAPAEMFTKRKNLFGEDFLLLGKWKATPL